MKTLEQIIDELSDNEKAILITLATHVDGAVCPEIRVLGPSTGKRLADYSVMAWLEKMERLDPAPVLSEIKPIQINSTLVKPKLWKVNPEALDYIKQLRLRKK